MAGDQWRLPAEWERQTATLLAWPAASTAWNGPHLAAVQQEFRDLINAILPFQDVVLLCHPDAPPSHELVPENSRLHRIEVAYNDTWCRDYGPVTLVNTGRRLALDFTFNGWGGKFDASLDNRANQTLACAPLFEHFQFRQHLFELEGGAIDCDGQGAVLINWHCISTRYPKLSRGALESELLQLLQAERILGIDVPPLPGDDTDGHIDTIARFIDAETIVFQQGDPDWTRDLREQLESLRTAAGQPYRLIALPAVAGAHRNEDGDTLATSYVNFLFVNGALIIPSYGDAADHRAMDILRPLVPDRELISLSARTIIHGNGSIHCCAMNLPAALP